MKYALVLVLTLVGCSSCGPITPIPPSTDPTAADICGKWATLECEEGLPTPEGTPCIVWVENAMDIEGFSNRFPCIMRATSCDQSRACQ
jgi:hypothetical protein